MEEIIYKIMLESIAPAGIDKAAFVEDYERINVEKLSEIESVEMPYLINVAGIPGSGKSTYCSKLRQLPQHKNALYISFDEIMQLHQFYQHETFNIKNTSDASEIAENEKQLFSRWEIPARLAGYELLRRAIAKRVSVILDHSASLSGHVDLFKYLTDKEGYKIHFMYMDIKTEDAESRIRQREIEQKKSGEVVRIVPVHYLPERFTILQKLLPEYEKICTSFQKILQ